MSFIGIDFGTSNSLTALAENDRVQFVEYADGSASNPTILYLPAKSKQFYIGNEAVELYLHDLEESGIGGRLMLSIKTLLPDAKFDYTMVAGHGRLTSEDLVARFLSVFKRRAEQQFSRKFDSVVLGRPVDFSEIAVSRLEKAAKIAGFKEVVFWFEPVAAAMAYEMTANSEELICVVDMGGGTTDICVIETSPARSSSPERLSDIKAVSGIYEAGDELNSAIMKNKLAERFGANSTFVSMGKRLPFPVHIIHKLSRWHRINLLNTSGEKQTLLNILPSSDRPDDVLRVLNLIENRYGFELFRSIDAAKKYLSNEPQAKINFRPLDLHEKIRVEEFEAMIADTATRTESAILECLQAASVRPENIDRVILTGGTSQVPLFNRKLIEIFGANKILRPDYFSSVATGLGFAAARLNQ